MKMYKKSDLQLINGMLVSGDEIVMPAASIVDQANRLETLVQKAEYLASQPSAAPMPSLDGFERKSENEIREHFTAITPVTDAKVMEAMAIMDEADDIAISEAANELLANFTDLAKFVREDYVIDCGTPVPAFDTPELGSILELTMDDVMHAIAKVCGMDAVKCNGNCDECEFADETVATEDDVDDLDAEEDTDEE
jgi:hypothetical protein